MKISVALCTYNGEKYITEQINSILNQETKVDEIIICDDGSTDNTIGFIEPLIQQNPIIKLYRSSVSLGIVKNFEKAINLCSNGLVLLSDQDDIWFPNKVKEITDYLRNNPTKKAILHNLLLCDQKLENLHVQMWDKIQFDKSQYASNDTLLRRLLLVQNVVTGAAFAFIKDNEVNFERNNTDYLHDYQLALKFAEKDELGFLNKNLGYYRQHNDQNVGTVDDENLYFKNYIETIFNPKDLAYKLRFVSESLPDIKSSVKNSIYSSLFEEFLSKEITSTKSQFLSQCSIFEKKKTLFLWWTQKKYSTKFIDIFTS